jgi:hypothetical protein
LKTLPIFSVSNLAKIIDLYRWRADGVLSARAHHKLRIVCHLNDWRRTISLSFVIRYIADFDSKYLFHYMFCCWVEGTHIPPRSFLFLDQENQDFVRNGLKRKTFECK